MTLDDIARVQSDVVQAAVRARDVGFQWLQLHFAHGYLAQNFWSTTRTIGPKCTVQRGESRTLSSGNANRRAQGLAGQLTLAVRLSVVEFDGNDEVMISESIELLQRMKSIGLDSVDVSIGFNTPTAKIPWGPTLLEDIAARVLRESGLPGTNQLVYRWTNGC